MCLGSFTLNALPLHQRAPVFLMMALTAGLASCYGEKDEGMDADGGADPAAEDFTGDDHDATVGDGEADPALDDFTGDDHDATVGDADGGNGGCVQELPGIVSHAVDFCSAQFPVSCLSSPCGECEVCYVDISCAPFDNPDAPNCGCWGDGRCHALCSVNGDCGAGEECIKLCWADGTDVVGDAMLWVCWDEGASPAARCD